ncbi:stage III sporulation protein AF [Cohnella thermotolerans]|uniref:stage III sporulation protein AF n=1 Tax=Cohnella thermotolerans TaxID=329858 RepID=UPI000422B186|nr:stage III sporulation protein AF [Cohnella thermotolerans]
MIAALSGWLTQVVAVVLLASLVDLLLPNRTMQRYVRLVAGLFVLLTVATPVLQWFRNDFGTKLASGLEKVQWPSGASSAELEFIEAEGRRLGEARNEQAVRLATAQLAADIRQAVESSGIGSVKTVDVKTEPNGAGGSKVAEVELVLAAEDGQPGTSGKGKATGAIADVEPVEPVAPVDIDIGADGRDVPAGADEADAAQPADGELFRRVAELLSNRFGIGQDQVRVWLDASGASY